jgi:ABC-2 type transport system ATP-binding protein
MITVSGLSKSYGKKTVLDDITLSIEPGMCYGLLGNNGAGKSTLINILLDLVKADAGAVSISGMTYPFDTLRIRKVMGVLPEKDTIHAELSAYEQLQMTAMLYGIPAEVREERILSLFRYFFESEDDIDKPCGSFSTGMRKKVGIIAAMLHKPDILVLDEPFSGLDPGSSVVLIDFLRTYLSGGRLALISSHNLSYVEQLATHVGVLHDRKLLFNGTKSAFLEKGSGLIDRTLFDLLNQPPKSNEHLQWLLG